MRLQIKLHYGESNLTREGLMCWWGIGRWWSKCEKSIACNIRVRHSAMITALRDVPMREQGIRDK